MSKTNKIIYWIATIWLSLGMVSTGMVQLLQQKDGPGGVASMSQLGYPRYLLTLLAVCKFSGVVAILIPRFALLKEWAYAGFFFLMAGAIYSHVAARDAVSEIFPALLLLILTIVSWYFTPPGRKVIAVPK